MKTQRTKKNEPAAPRNEYAQARERLNRYLALRDHSRFELRQKLSRKFTREVIDRLMAQAEEAGWLPTEEQIAERAVRALARRQKSQRHIEGQLRKRGLPVPPSTSSEEHEEPRIRHLVNRKFGDSPLSFEDKAKAYRFLKYRGFKDQAIRRVLNEKP